ncbi:uncharacterized protein LOC107783463 isoform X5 [Nicotiana tabacum]|uniref:Uncharacterized protein LOC107783463 isoform X5 n=2 Tax=Nicotiana TaxID=4085 RepID=A0A1S3Z653_TOBAC|nr:PREDICTED: uncharacterized protein LOC104242073 isoform X5 [Nicotiana sylvestris]XP_016459950.1 PREDICTED: uncharacterized protein LOC107783463 isoform X5 [Nicotiana tabacum]
MSSSSLTITLSSSLRSSSSLPLLLHRLLHRHVSISSVLCTRHLYLPQKQLTSRHLLRRCSVNGDNSVYKSPEFQNSPLDQKGIFQKENHENSQTESLTSNKFYVAPSPGRMGYLAAVERFLKVMAMVWAGSQVTKLVRAGGALALAPFVDRGLSWFTTKMNFESQGKAFMVIAGFCFGLAFMMFLIVTLLWA